MNKIIVEIKGGLVRAIWSTDKNIQAEVLDRDLPETDEDCDELIKEITRQEAEIKDLGMVDIL